MQIEIASTYAGPPRMGHGGYVAGLFANRTKGAVQVTLRRPTPLDVPLELVDLGDLRLELRDGDELVAVSEPATLDIDVPSPPSPDAARKAEPGSPSHFNGKGVHPTCFGCGLAREARDGLRIAAGPLTAGGTEQVAAVWRPALGMAGDDGLVERGWLLAALDCPGAFAFIAAGVRAGLLGRIVFDQYDDVRPDDEHVVTGWQIGTDGRKMLAGTALFGPDGSLLAAARATWFGFPQS